MTFRSARMVIAVALAASALVPAGAQDRRALRARPDAATQAAFFALLDSARAQGLPVQPLYAKLYEGLGKGADGPRIVAAVRTLSGEMADAQRVLGTVATAEEIKAAASAMHAGVPASELGRLKPEGKLRRSLTLPLTVLTDIVSRGVPVSTAVSAVRALVGAGARDTDLSDFQRNVRVDIEQGAPPGAAAETRAKRAVPPGKPESPEQ